MSHMGKLYHSDKSEIVKCLHSKPDCDSLSAPPVGVTILDGPAVINMMKPDDDVKSFEQYANKQFIPHVESRQGDRVDIIWDEYIQNSLKEMT